MIVGNFTCIHAKFSITDLEWTIMAHVINQIGCCVAHKAHPRGSCLLDNGDNAGNA